MPKAGDRVKIETKDEVLEGILMPRPDILDQNIVVIKLDSGYNVGIEKKKIKKTSLLKEYKHPKSKKKIRKHNKDLPTVAVLSTGGTISSKIDYRTGGVFADYTAEEFIEMCPEISDIANIKAKRIMSMMSEDFRTREWSDMAKEIAKELNGVDGVVVTQGTDTLHYSTAAMSFLLNNLGKPVVFTASQRSIDRGSSDAFMNLTCAIAAAASFDGAEVMSCLHGTTDDSYCLLVRGTKVRKMHTSRRDAFRPMNEKPIAKVFQNGMIQIMNKNYKKRSDEKTTVDKPLVEDVALVYVYPAMDPGIIDYHIKQGVKGIVLAATALGHVPTESKKSLLPAIERAIKKKIPVVVASQTLYGSVHPYVYTNLRKLSIQLKCIFVDDMLPEVAYIKMMHVLSKTTNMKEVKYQMQQNVAGEMARCEPIDSFLS